MFNSHSDFTEKNKINFPGSTGGSLSFIRMSETKMGVKKKKKENIRRRTVSWGAPSISTGAKKVVCMRIFES